MATPLSTQWSSSWSDGMFIKQTKLLECPVVAKIPLKNDKKKVIVQQIIKKNVNENNKKINWVRRGKL